MNQNNPPTNSRPEAENKPTSVLSDKREWSKPEITSFAPLSEAAGISYRPGDGISNQSY